MGNRWRVGIGIAALAMIACSNGDDDVTTPDSGPDGTDAATPDGSPDAPMATDCGGSDGLEVHVVDADGRATTGTAIAGATVVVDCDGARLIATTDASGNARFEGLDFAGDPPTVTVFAEGSPARTRVAVDAAFAAEERPLVFRMGGFLDPAGATRAVSVTLEGGTAGASAMCWAEAEEIMPRHHLGPNAFRAIALDMATWSIDLYDEVGASRLGCVQYTGAALPRTVVSATATDVAADATEATLTFPGDTALSRFDVELRYPADNPYAAGREVEAFVQDQRDDNLGAPIGMMENLTSSGGTETISIAWAPSLERGRATFDVALRAIGGSTGWSLTNIPVDAVPAAIDVRAPVALTALPVLTPGHEVVFVGGEWADEVAVFITGTGGQTWAFVVPRSVGSFRVPAPPEGRTYEDVLPSAPTGVFLVGWKFDAPPPPDHWTGPWYDAHFVEGGWRSNFAVVAD